VTVDNDNPVVTITYPNNNLPYNTSNINTNGISDFNYTATDNNTLNNCSLYINSEHYQTELNNYTEVNFSALTKQNNPYTWTINCTDQAGNTGTANGNVYYDNIAPNITNVNSTNIDHEYADINWTTTEITSNTVFYGTDNTNTTGWDSETVTGTSVNANVKLSDLDASTTYYYYVYSEDQFGLNDTDNNTNVYYNFITTATPSSVSSSGGGSGNNCDKGYTKVGSKCVKDPVETSGSCEPVWNCELEWSGCNSEGFQTRTCNDISSCGVEDVIKSKKCAVSIESTGGDVSGSGDSTGSGSGGVDQFGGTGSETGGSSPGVGAATGIFGQVASNWYWIVAALSLIALLVLAGWKGPTIAKFIKGKNAAKLAAEEKAMRAKLRDKGLIK
ncbi:MAG: hypothetical protein ABIG93_05495, partial [archaeon]